MPPPNSDMDSKNEEENEPSGKDDDKRKKSRKSRNTLEQTSLPSLTASTSRLLQSSVERLPTNLTPSHRVFEALAKFQSVLFILSNTVVRLQESLKLLIPIQRNDIPSGPSTASSNQSEMVKHSICPLAKRRSHDDKKDTVVSIASLDDPIPEVEKKKPKKSPKVVVYRSLFRLFKYVGIILTLFTSVCMSLVTLVVKFMDGYHPVSKVIWRLQGVLLPSVFIILYVRFYQKRPLILWRKEGSDVGIKKSENWQLKIFFLLVLRGVVGCSADIFQYYSLKSLPLADSTVISFSTPIFVCIVAHFILKEKCGVVPIFTAILTLSGVIVICRPPILTGAEGISNSVLIGNVLAVLCMISNTFTTVIMRYLQHIHFAVTMLALGIFGTIEGFIVSLWTSPLEIPKLNSGIDWSLAVIIAGLFFFGQLTMTLALQHEEAGVVSLVRTCDVLFAFLWQVNFLHQDANLYSYIGAVIVTLGVVITAIRRWVGDLPEDSEIRNRLGFMLR